MPQDAFSLRRNAEELHSLLVGGKVNKIVQPDKETLLLYIYTGKSLLKLLLCTKASFCRAALTSQEKTPLPVPPNFCMLLRKYLLGAQIKRVEQVGFERILAFTFSCVSDFSTAERVLYCEIMGKYSNVVLTENGTILGALKTASLEENRKRVLFPGLPYALPAPQDKANPLEKESLAAALAGYAAAEDKANYLFERVAGIAYPTAAQIAALHEKSSLPIGEFLQEYLFDGAWQPCLVFSQGKPKEFAAKLLPNAEPRESLQAAQDELYAFAENEKAFGEKRRRLIAAVTAQKKKQEKNLARTLEKLKECEGGEELRLFGELITANIYKLERGMSACKLENYYDPAGGEVTIPLDKTLTPAQNAQKYFKRYAKLKRTVEALAPRKEAEEKELSYADSVLSSLELAEEDADLSDVEEELAMLGWIKNAETRKKQATPTPFRVFEKDGFTILAGRNNVQNDRLLRAAAPYDVWLHTQKYHSSHVVVLTGGRTLPNEVLLFAAQVCARYSDGKDGSKIPVDYCLRRFVKKPAKAKAGFVTYTDFKTVVVDPLTD